jgi:hypothetical protein
MPNSTPKGYARTRFSLQGNSSANIKSMVVTCIFVTADSRAEKPRLECQSDEAIWYDFCASALGTVEVEELFTIGDCCRNRCSVQPRSLHPLHQARAWESPSTEAVRRDASSLLQCISLAQPTHSYHPRCPFSTSAEAIFYSRLRQLRAEPRTRSRPEANKLQSHD